MSLTKGAVFSVAKVKRGGKKFIATTPTDLFNMNALKVKTTKR